MKKQLILCISICIFMGVLSVNAYKKDPEYLHAKRSGAPVKIIVSTYDDDNKPVSNATIKVLMGMHYREEAYFINGETDQEGKFVVEGITKGNEIEITVTRDGYYKAFKRLCFTQMGREYEVKNGKWQPWGMEVSLPLREKRNPIPLVRMAKFIDLVSTNQWVGFDMKEKDWIATGHKGKVADFEAKLIWDGEHLSRTKQTDLQVRFVGDGAGYYLADKTPYSAFPGVYHASTNAPLLKEFWCRTATKNWVCTQTGVPEGKRIIARTRCKLNSQQEVIEANYSSFRAFTVEGDGNGKADALIKYDFNPTPNDTNLEPANMP